MLNSSKNKIAAASFDISGYLRAYWKEYSLYLFLILAYASLSLIVPFYLSAWLNRIADRIFDMRHTLIFLSVILLEFFLYIAVQVFNVRLSNKIAFRMEYDTLNHIKYVPFSTIRKYNDAYLTQRINNDAVCIGDYLVEKLPFFLSDILLITGTYAVVFSIHTQIGILFLLFLCAFAAVYLISKKVLYARRNVMLESQSGFFAMLSNQIFNILLIKLNSWYEEANQEFTDGMIPFFKSSIRFLRANFTVTGITRLLNRILYGGSILILGIGLAQNKMNIGELATIAIYIQLLLSKMQELTQFGQNREQFLVAKDRISELFQMPSEQNGETRLSSVQSIQVKSLSVAYGSKVIFTGINAAFQKGKIYLIMGENGAGKTTFIHTLLGITETSGGSILYNGTDISELDLYALRRNNIAVANQEPILQNGTIAQNLTYGTDKITCAGCSCQKTAFSMQTASSGVRELLSFTRRLSGGLNTPVSSKNITLSGGEKQKVEICRVLLKNADVMIFDEPTSALDADSIGCFIREIDRIRSGHIIIMISHDDKLKEIADKVLVF